MEILSNLGLTPEVDYKSRNSYLRTLEITRVRLEASMTTQFKFKLFKCDNTTSRYLRERCYLQGNIILRLPNGHDSTVTT